MRKLHWLLGITVGCAAIGFVACGGSSSDNNNNTTPDASAGSDAKNDVAPVVDAGPPDVIEDAAEPPCQNDADLSKITVPDAALGDSGASVGTCIKCGKDTCGPEFDDCQADCECRSAFSDFYDCLGADGGSIFSCGQGLFGNGIPGGATTALLQCVGAGCSDECGLSLGTDAGADAAKDAAKD
jgi:hypothetical protein